MGEVARGGGRGSEFIRKDLKAHFVIARDDEHDKISKAPEADAETLSRRGLFDR
jgi:hypothetical protein